MHELKVNSLSDGESRKKLQHYYDLLYGEIMNERQELFLAQLVKAIKKLLCTFLYLYLFFLLLVNTSLVILQNENYLSSLKMTSKSCDIKLKLIFLITFNSFFLLLLFFALLPPDAFFNLNANVTRNINKNFMRVTKRLSS